MIAFCVGTGLKSDDINIRKDRENADVAVMECAR